MYLFQAVVILNLPVLASSRKILKISFNVPAVCITHCPFVSSPLLSGSPAVAGCSVSAPGCSRTLSIGCLLYSRWTELKSYIWINTKLAVSRWGKNAYCSSFSAVHIAVWDDLGKCDNPVVDLVSSSPLNWWFRKLFLFFVLNGKGIFCLCKNIIIIWDDGLFFSR